jgi:alpha-tubulin suppressor-like RCC1 family protein
MGDATTTERLAPVQVKGAGGVGFISGVSTVEAGGSFTCAVKADTSAWCWGRNDRGQLGDNTTTDALSPVQVVGLGGTGFLTGVSDMSVGGSHTCAVKTDTSVSCWGRNDRGQLGDDTTTDRLTPAQVKGAGGVGLLTGVLRVTTGGSHTCAVKADTTMWCWGRNGQGQLGDNTTIDRLSPVQVRDTAGTAYLTGVLIADSSGKESTCAIKTDWSTWCWGNNPRGQVGDGTVTDRLTPVQVVGSSGTGNLGASELLGVGGEHACAVSNVDVFNCWGGNTRGQIGDGTTMTRVYPTPASITP